MEASQILGAWLSVMEARVREPPGRLVGRRPKPLVLTRITRPGPLRPLTACRDS